MVCMRFFFFFLQDVVAKPVTAASICKCETTGYFKRRPRYNFHPSLWQQKADITDEKLEHIQPRLWPKHLFLTVTSSFWAQT